MIRCTFYSVRVTILNEMFRKELIQISESPLFVPSLSTVLYHTFLCCGAFLSHLIVSLHNTAQYKHIFPLLAIKYPVVRWVKVPLVNPPLRWYVSSTTDSFWIPMDCYVKGRSIHFSYVQYFQVLYIISLNFKPTQQCHSKFNKHLNCVPTSNSDTTRYEYFYRLNVKARKLFVRMKLCL